MTKIKINRAPVLTLWAAVVAETLGYDSQAALTLGRAVAGMNAQSKGRSLGIYEGGDDPGPGQGSREPGGQRTETKETGVIHLLGRIVPVASTRDGLRATLKDDPLDPASVERYLKSKFRDQLSAAREAMQTLAQSLQPEELERRAFELYEQFRPEIPAGVRGWGAAGDLDLDEIRQLAESK